LFSLGAERAPGAATLAELAGLPERLREADIVLTGEGSYDFSSLRGKVVSWVAETALAEAVPCLVVAGSVTVGRREMLASGVNAAYSLVDEAGSSESAIAEPERWVRQVTARVARQWSRS
jgi:glycerate kinase